MKLIIGTLLLALVVPASAQTKSYEAQVVRVIDGDTVRVSVPAWEGSPFSPINVRIAGIDTPESRKQGAKCPEELILGKAAAAYARTLLKPGEAVTIAYQGLDKYSRIDGDLVKPGFSFAREMLSAGHAFPYYGKTKRSYCFN